jgi:hypothetical protein
MRSSGLVALGLWLACGAASAAEHTVEITPMAGFRRSGGITVEERAFQQKDVDLNLSSSGVVGLTVDMRIYRGLMMELLVSHQSTTFQDKRGLFGETPGGLFPVGPLDLLDATVLQYHGGLLFELDGGWERKFLCAGLGIARIDPSLPLAESTRMAANAGAGVKMDMNTRLAARLEGRFYWIDTDEEESAQQSFTHRDCTDPCTYTYRYDSAIRQFELTLGLALKL